MDSYITQEYLHVSERKKLGNSNRILQFPILKSFTPATHRAKKGLFLNKIIKTLNL